MSGAPRTEACAIGPQIARRLQDNEQRLREEWESSGPVRHFVVDDLLSSSDVHELHDRVPATKTLMRKKSLRESKSVGVAVDEYHPAVGSHLFAFQHPDVIDVIGRITGIREMLADPSLYASGISVMEKGDFLNPHLDNSHDGDQKNYRVLNLLYYITPEWKLENGGNLELWSPNLDIPTVIESRFNRLVVMATDDGSWHSVQRVNVARARVCLSNYYFSSMAPGDHEYHNVTSFRGRPEEPVKRLLLRFDSALLNVIARLFPFLLKRNVHRRRSGEP